MNQLVTEARALCRDATEGPWTAIDKGNSVPSHAIIKTPYAGEPKVNIASGISPKTGNAVFIARSRTILPEMAAEIERLESKEKFLTEPYDRNAKIHEALTRDYLAVKSERDRFKARAEAAEKDMHTYIERNVRETSGRFACDLCIHGTFDMGCSAVKCDGIDAFEWRGLCAENGGNAHG